MTRSRDLLAHDDCSTFSQKLAAIWPDIKHQQCAFDVAEYGSSMGLTVESCMQQ